MAQDNSAQPDGYYGGYHVIAGERWWSEGALRAAEEREKRASLDERAAIVKWLRESVGSGPASLLADDIEEGKHRGQ